MKNELGSIFALRTSRALILRWQAPHQHVLWIYASRNGLELFLCPCRTPNSWLEPSNAVIIAYALFFVGITIGDSVP